MIDALKKTIYTTLSNDTTLTNLLNGGTISYGVAPSDSQFPYIVFYEVSEQTPNTHKVDYVDVLFDVRSVGVNEAVVTQIHERIRSVLHRASLSVSGWHVYRCNHINSSRFLEQQERIQVVKLTGHYRVTMNV